MNLLTLGIVLICIPILATFLILVCHDMYWMVRCLRKGGDWQYYACNLAVYLSLLMISCGLAFLIEVM